MPDHTLSELIALAADAERLLPLRSLCEHVQQHETDIASNGWDGSANPNSFDSHRYVLTTGTSTAYVATFSPAFGSLPDGLLLKVDIHTECGDSPTLNVNSLGAADIIKPDGTAVSAAELKAGYVYPMIYSAGLGDFVVYGIQPGNTYFTNQLFGG